MSDTTKDVYITTQFQLNIMIRIAACFDDKDDASNWFMYQKLSHFGGETAEEVLLDERCNISTKNNIII